MENKKDLRNLKTTNNFLTDRMRKFSNIFFKHDKFSSQNFFLLLDRTNSSIITSYFSRQYQNRYRTYSSKTKIKIS